MRPIDADALENDINTWGSNDFDKYDFIEAIENAPTVELDEITELGGEIVKIIKDIMPQLLEIAKNNRYTALAEKLTEQEKLVIIRAKIKLDNVALQYYKDKFKKEYEEGLILLPEYFEATVHDVIHDVKIEGGQT